MAMSYRDDGVALSPKQQRRHLSGEVEAIASVDPLTAEVHDRPKCVEERRAAVAIGQRRKAAAHLTEIRGETQPKALDRGDTGAPKRRDRPDRPGDDELRAGQRRRPQQRVQTPAQTAAGDEHGPLGPPREHVRELHRDAAPRRMALQPRAFVAELNEQVAKRAWK